MLILFFNKSKKLMKNKTKKPNKIYLKIIIIIKISNSELVSEEADLVEGMETKNLMFLIRMQHRKTMKNPRN